MKRRPLSDEQIRILRRILKGEHPSPGSGYLGWPQHGKPNRKFFEIVTFSDENERDWREYNRKKRERERSRRRRGFKMTKRGDLLL